MQAVINLLRGIVLGIANVIPGVSGGTMAVILGIYDKILACVSIKRLRQNLFFILTVGAGAVLGILGFSKVVTYLYDHFFEQTCFAFIGLILGSIPMIFGRARGEKLRLSSVLAFLLALAAMLAISFVREDGITQTIIMSLDVGTFCWLFFAGALSAFAMILPGISGSFVMLVLGCYATVIAAISDFNFVILLPVGLGILVGFVAGAKLVEHLLKRFPNETYSAILGLVVGSLFPLYPGLQASWGSVLSILIMMVFAAVAFFFSREKSAQ